MEDLRIVVAEPTKNSDSFGAYISYKVNTNTTRTEFEQRESSVIRRYSDFVWLVGELTRLYPGIIIPAIPDKQSVGRFSPEFVESRRRSLEKFLHRVAEHAELSNSQAFITFLQADDVRLKAAMELTKASKAKLTETAKGWFQSSINSLTVSSKIEVEKTTTDMKIEEISQYVVALEKQLQNVNRHATLMVKRSRDSAHTIFDFAQSLTWLGQCEGDELGAALTQVGTALDTMSVAATKHAESEVTELEEPLEEYARYAASVRAAVQVRQDKKSAYIAALTDFEVKQAAYNKILNQTGKEKETAAKQEAMEKAQGVVDRTKSEYEAVSEKLVAEFDNFKRQKSVDIRNILLAFVKLQIDFSRKCEQSWNDVTPVLENLALSSSFVPAAFANYGSAVGNRSDQAPSWVYGSEHDHESEESFISSAHNSAAVADEEFVGV